jgi:hypothetical protein
MSIITAHWSVTPPTRQRDYHIEFALTGTLSAAQITALGSYAHPAQVDWEMLKEQFTIYKNNDLSEVTSYGTWHMNSDPRDGSSNIEVAALTLDGSDVSTTGSWGPHPYTFAHAWMHAAIIARVCAIKNMDALAQFDPSVEASVLQNGPIYVVSTHGERALQTNDDGQDTVASRGYGMFSGDSQERWDIAALDPSQNSKLANPTTAIASVYDSAKWIRWQAHLIKTAGVPDLWDLDKDPT